MDLGPLCRATGESELRFNQCSAAAFGWTQILSTFANRLDDDRPPFDSATSLLVEMWRSEGG